MNKLNEFPFHHNLPFVVIHFADLSPPALVSLPLLAVLSHLHRVDDSEAAMGAEVDRRYIDSELHKIKKFAIDSYFYSYTKISFKKFAMDSCFLAA